MEPLIVILSDTHDKIQAVDEALRMIESLEPDLIIHCGDFTSPDIFQRFVGLPFQSVFGNCDYDREAFLEKAYALGMEAPQESLEFSIAQKRIFVTHGDRGITVNRAIASQEFDYIFHGHTHLASDEVDGKTRVMNPGAFTRVLTKTIAQLSVQTGQWKLLPVQGE